MQKAVFTVETISAGMGEVLVTVLFAELHINKSPYEVDVGMAQGDSSAGVGEVEVVIMDPPGEKDAVVCQIEDKGNSSYRCSYKPTLEGPHTIYVTFAGGQISKSPFTVNIGEGETGRGEGREGGREGEGGRGRSARAPSLST
ncbi:unnamed protein product [Coregonus sp. 'balchen']|nr:unnamed protein product [Coregonus sp. 'balchen']